MQNIECMSPDYVKIWQILKISRCKIFNAVNNKVSLV